MPKIKTNSVDLTELKKSFESMDNEKGKIGLALLDEIIFQQTTLAKMRKDIEESSLIAEYSNYKRSNPVIAGYNAMIKNYSTLIKQAVELLPETLENEMSASDLMNIEY